MSGTPHDFLSDLVGRYGVRRQDLLVLSSDKDPFNAGTRAHLASARWFADVYEQLGSPHVPLRDLHYAIVARMLPMRDGRVYEGTAKDWYELGTASGRARDLGLVSPWSFIDKRTQSHWAFDNVRDPVDDPTLAPGAVLLDRPKFYPPTWAIYPPRLEDVLAVLASQPLVLELWIEKHSEALNAEVVPLARRFGCRVLVGAGYQSKTAAADLVRRAIVDGRERVVLWLADADKSGENMAVATARHAELICRHWIAEHEPETVVPRIVMDRVALTLDQLASVEAEIGREIPVSPDVGRAEGRVELQALAAFAPGWVAVELERRLAELTDDLGADLAGWRIKAGLAVRAAWEAEIGEYQEALRRLEEKRDEILERFDLAAIDAAFEEIEPERRELLHEIWDAVDGFDPDLPALPEAEVDLDGLGRDWLFDTERDYGEQLNAYRRQMPAHKRRPPLILEERVCEGCGEPILGRRRFHGGACRKRWERSSP